MSSHYKSFLKSIDRLRDKYYCSVISSIEIYFSDESTYPLYEFVIGDGYNLHAEEKQLVLLTGGVHGDEPAGTLAIMRFLNEEVESYLNKFSFLVFPCVNPSGYDRGTRKNIDGFNLNREFKRGYKTQELDFILRNHLLKNGFLFTMDMHETSSEEDSDDNESEYDGAYPDEYYLYESCWDEELRVGSKIIREIEKEFPVCKWEKVADDINSGGVIYGPQVEEGNPYYAEMSSFEGGLLKMGYTEHSFTVETPTCWDLDRRIDAQVKTLKLALKLCS